jgi:phage terminase small subunit
MALTPKQQRFVQEYLVDSNASQAALRAGYSPNTAESQGCRLLKNAKVAAAIAEGQKKTADKLGVTAERVVAEMAKLAFGDVRALFDEAGNLKPPHEWGEEAAAIVAGLDVVTRNVGDGEVEHVAKIKQWDKPKALEMLARHLGLFNDKLHVTGVEDLAAKLRRGRERAKRR